MIANEAHPQFWFVLLFQVPDDDHPGVMSPGLMIGLAPDFTEHSQHVGQLMAKAEQQEVPSVGGRLETAYGIHRIVDL